MRTPWNFPTNSRHPGLRATMIAVLLALTVFVAGCSGAGNAPKGGTTAVPVKLALDWTPNTNHTGIYAAQQQGWYKQNGVDLSILPYGNVTPEQLVATGQADFAISFIESVTLARAQGLPLVGIGAVLQHNTSALVTLKSSGLDSVQKLAGKTYAGFGSGYEQPVIQQMLTCAGAPNTNFKNVTYDGDPIAALKSGKFDFAWIYLGWEGVEAQQQGLTLNTFMVNDYCIPDYHSPVIITSEKMMQEHPDVVQHFMQTTQRGYQYAIARPHDAADLLIQGAPKGSFDDKDLVYKSQDYLSPKYAAAGCWGMQTEQAWTNFPRFLYQHGSVQDANGQAITTLPDFKKAYTNKFVPGC